MIEIVSADTARLTRYSPRRPGNYKTNYIGEDRNNLKGAAPDRNALTPVAYLVEQGPGNTLGSHYHVANQFQVFVLGDGKIGSHAAAPGVGHFAGPYTAYGPIVPGEQGVGYLTLRNGWDDGAQYLPAAYEKLKPKKDLRREVLFAPAPKLSADELRALRTPLRTPLIAEQADGLCAWAHHVPPNQSIAGMRPSTGGGQYWVVMGGQLIDKKQGSLPRLSCAFVSPEEEPFVATAGAEGLDILEMLFPLFTGPV